MSQRRRFRKDWHRCQEWIKGGIMADGPDRTAIHNEVSEPNYESLSLTSLSMESRLAVATRHPGCVFGFGETGGGWDKAPGHPCNHQGGGQHGPWRPMEALARPLPGPWNVTTVLPNMERLADARTWGHQKHHGALPYYALNAMGP